MNGCTDNARIPKHELVKFSMTDTGPKARVIRQVFRSLDPDGLLWVLMQEQTFETAPQKRG